MKKIQDKNPTEEQMDDLQDEYSFDYNKAKKNRFAGKTYDSVVVVLDPDVSKFFKTPESVNEALRNLISQKNS